MKLDQYFSKFPELKIVYDQVEKEYITKNPVHHNWTHVLRDLGKAILLGEGEGANMKVVVAGILLHDIGRLYPESGKEHYIVGAEVAPPYLRCAGFTAEEIKEVVHCIRCNGPRGVENPETVEAQICYDVDFGCAGGYIGVARAFHHFMGEADMTVRQMAEFPKERIVPEKDLYTETGKNLVAENLKKAKKFWEMFDQEFAEEEKMIKQIIPGYKGD